MSMIRVAAAVVAAGLLAGCTPKPKEMAPPPPPAPMGASVSLDQARGYFKGANPQSLVGVVRAVRGDHNMIAASDLAEAGIQIDDSVSIVGPSSEYPLVANGTVDKVDSQYVIIKYLPALGRRRRAITWCACRRCRACRLGREECHRWRSRPARLPPREFPPPRLKRRPQPPRRLQLQRRHRRPRLRFRLRLPHRLLRLLRACPHAGARP